MMVAMYIETVPNRNSPPCILLRESFRHQGKVKHRTLANLTDWPKHIVAGLLLLLKGHQPSLTVSSESFRITRSLPHGHVEAVSRVVRALGLDALSLICVVADGPAGLSEVTCVLLLVTDLALLPCGPSDWIRV